MREHFRGLAHIGVMTKNLEESLAFYRLLGGVENDRATLETPEGTKTLVLMEVGGIIVELIQPPVPVESCEGVVSHFALYVDDIDAAHDAMVAAGIDTFQTPVKNQSSIFGGVANWFFTGPNGERIELMETLK
jgi:lactoylglutathione lyase